MANFLLNREHRFNAEQPREGRGERKKNENSSCTRLFESLSRDCSTGCLARRAKLMSFVVQKYLQAFNI